MATTTAKKTTSKKTTASKTGNGKGTTKKTTAKRTSSKKVSESDIREQAQAIYEKRLKNGAPGDAISDWVRAEELLGVK